MVKVDEYARIRRAHFVDGLGIKAIARHFQRAFPDDRMTFEQEPFGAQVSYSYDGVGDVTLQQDNLNGAMTYTYDQERKAINAQFSQSGSTPSQAGIEVDHNGDSTVSQIRYYATAAETTIQDTTRFAYNSADRLYVIDRDHSQGDTDYTYTSDSGADDGPAQVSVAVQHGVTGSYTYDSDGQLTLFQSSSYGTHTYSYDAEGNSAAAGTTIGTDNEIQTDGTYNYSYDADGNRTTKISISGGDAWTYAYDDMNRLITVKHWSSSSGGVPTGTVLLEEDFTYDVFGNRLSDTLTQSGSTTATRFAYDQDGNAWADLNSSNQLVERHLFLPGVDQIFARIDASTGHGYFYYTDDQGSVTDIVDESTGLIVDKIDYDAFGNIANETAATYSDRYKYTGREWDAAIDLQYSRARWYDPITRTFISQDPAQADPLGNAYRYVENDPMDGTDPSGRNSIPESGASRSAIEMAPKSNLTVGKELITVDSPIYKKYENDPISKETMDTMINKGSFYFPNATLLDQEIEMRKNVIKAMETLNKKDGLVTYPTPPPDGKLNSIRYQAPPGWTVVTPPPGKFGPSFSWTPSNDLKTASDAIKALFAGPTTIDCTTAAALAYWKGLLDTIGQKEFNQRFEKGIKIGFNFKTNKRFAGPWSQRPQPRENEGNGTGANMGVILPGDWVDFFNVGDYQARNPGGFFNTENAFYMGDKKYEGFGVRSVSRDDMFYTLYDEYWRFNNGPPPGSEWGQRALDYMKKQRVDFMGKPNTRYNPDKARQARQVRGCAKTILSNDARCQRDAIGENRGFAVPAEPRKSFGLLLRGPLVCCMERECPVISVAITRLFCGFWVVGLAVWCTSSGGKSIETTPYLSLPLDEAAQPLFVFACDNRPICVACSPVDQVFVTVDQEDMFRIVSLGNGKEIKSWKGESGTRSVTWSRDGRLLASAADDGFVSVTRVRDGKRLWGKSDCGDSVSFSPDGKELAIGFRNAARPGIEIRKVDGGELIRYLKAGEPSESTQLSYLEGGRGLIWKTERIQRINSDDGRAAAEFADSQGLWGMFALSEKLGIVVAPCKKVSRIGVGPDPFLIASWETKTGDRKEDAFPHAGRILCLEFDRSGILLASGSKGDWNRGELRVFDMKANREICRVRNAHRRVLYDLSFSADGKSLVTCGGDLEVKVWVIRKLLSGNKDG